MTLELNLAEVTYAVASRVPDRAAIIRGSQAWTYQELTDRATRLAGYLAARGLGAHRERSELRPHQAGQDFLAQYLHNGPEYLEGMLGAFRARLAPFNVNYRYVTAELRKLLNDACPNAIQYHAAFAPTLAEVLPQIAPVAMLLQVDDGSGHDLLPGAMDYEEALAGAPAQVNCAPSSDDLYVLYTGGTTGLPKGVLWRQADIAVAAMGQRNRRAGDVEWDSLSDKLAALPSRPHRILALAPFMHGAAQWAAMQTLLDANSLVIQREVTRLDPADVLDTIEQHQVTTLTIVGDAFARPLADEQDHRPRNLSSVRFVVSGGAALTPAQKQRLAQAIPSATILENLGASETGPQGHAVGTAGGHSRPTFHRGPNTLVVSEDKTSVLRPGHDSLGWLATAGRIPLGYLHDEEKTAQTFLSVAGQRVAVPGDRARLLPGDLVELFGRDATTINSGGEKIFGEEVEAALKSHPRVADAAVCGRPSQRWGAEVVALVTLRDGAEVDSATLIDHCSTLITRFKLPKVVIFVDEIARSPSGKLDYGWVLARARSHP
jgi:fatty-acyl-CoA synthase